MSFLSIVIPVYNVEEYIQACVESVLIQTFTDYEVILVDDGSTDNCPTMCDLYAEQHSQIRVIHQCNGGLSAARNTGIKHAAGEYILFLDSDDFLVGKDALKKIAVPLRNLKPDFLMYLAAEFDASGSEILVEHKQIDFATDKVYPCRDILEMIYVYNGIWVTMAQTKIIRREYLEENGLYFKQGIYHEDDEWVNRVLISDPTISFSYDAVYGYRHRANSIITTTNKEKMYKKACDKMDTGAQMLKSEWIKKSPAYAKYAAQYFLGAVTQVNHMDSNYAVKFLQNIGEYENMFRYFGYSKSKSLILYSMIQRIFGTKMLLRLMK